MKDKYRIKKIICVFMLFAFLAGMAGGGVSAASDLVFLCINDTFIKSMTSSNMPIKINNSMYISYRYLARIKLIKYFYDEDMRLLKLYNSSATLIFDVRNSITYDQDGKIYSYLAEVRNGVLFVPIEFICRVFGVVYSQFSSDYGPVIRINSIMSSYNDSELLSVNKDTMKQIYDDYYPIQETPTQPETPDKPDTPSSGDVGGGDVSDPGGSDTDAVRKTLYMAFCGEIGENTTNILSVMDIYGYKGTFFVSQTGLSENADDLRRIVASGHSLGLYVSSADPVGEANSLNDLLSALVLRKTRLVCIKDGSAALTAEQRVALTEGGYRIWDASLDPGSLTKSAYSVGLNAQRLLTKASKTSVLKLYSTEAAAEGLLTVIKYLRSENFIVQRMTDWTTPINNIGYYK
ncbi:MAG: polysaccharide deacetylase family protein [Clostridiaceae bacterium]|nr:polysaccharide deacetylase family protein [Clostridiaceae bacterium]